MGSSGETGSSRREGVLRTRDTSPAIEVLGCSASKGGSQKVATCMGVSAAKGVAEDVT